MAPVVSAHWPHLLFRWGFFVGSMVSVLTQRDNPMNDERINIRADKQLKELAQLRAASQGQSLSAYIKRLILADAVKQERAA